MKQSRAMLPFVLPIAVIGTLFVVFFFGSRGADVAQAADEIVRTCAGDSSREACYEREVPARYGEFSVKELFDVIHIIRSRDPSYQFCHVLAHKIGERAVEADPERWLSLIPLNPSDGLCSNGFIHGVIVGRFRDDVFDEAMMRATIPDFRIACEPHDGWTPSPLDQAICYHGMGHLFMFLTDADYRRALDACAAIEKSPTGDFGQVCREGVFMQTYQPLEPDDFDLVALLPEEPKRENYRRICAQFTRDEEEGACLREAWPLFREQILAGGVSAFCEGNPPSQIDQCYDTGFAIIGRQSQSRDKAPQITKACGGAPRERQGLCFGIVAVAFIEENRRANREAAGVCGAAPSHAQERCYSTLIERINFVYGADEAGKRALCDALPADAQTRCLTTIMPVR